MHILIYIEYGTVLYSAPTLFKGAWLQANRSQPLFTAPLALVHMLQYREAAMRPHQMEPQRPSPRPLAG
jgi:hypothetical protein